MKLYDQVTIELPEDNSALLSEKLNKYSLDGWHFVSFLPNKVNTTILLEKEVGYETFLTVTGLISKNNDLCQKMSAMISVTQGKEMYIECIEKNGRIGVCFDQEGTSSWYVVKDNGYSASGTLENIQKLIDSVIEYKLIKNNSPQILK